MKKVLALVLALVLVLGCTSALADTVTLTYSEVDPAGHDRGQNRAVLQGKS